MGTPGRDEKKKSFSFACVVGVPRNESARRNCGVKGGKAEGVVRGGGGRQREETGCHLIQEGESLRLPRSSPV